MASRKPLNESRGTFVPSPNALPFPSTKELEKSTGGYMSVDPKEALNKNWPTIRDITIMANEAVEKAMSPETQKALEEANQRVQKAIEEMIPGVCPECDTDPWCRPLGVRYKTCSFHRGKHEKEKQEEQERQENKKDLETLKVEVKEIKEMLQKLLRVP